MKALLLENLLSPDENMGNIFSGSIVRYVVPLVDNVNDAEEDDNYIEDHYDEAQAIRKGDKVVLIPEVVCVGVDYAVANAKYTGKEYKFAYAINTYVRKGADNSGNCVMKIHLDTQATQMWNGNEGQVPSFPIFIPNPNTTDEDDGVVVFGVTEGKISSNNATSQNAIIFLDARSFQELARATVKERFLASWIHGIFLHASA